MARVRNALLVIFAFFIAEFRYRGSFGNVVTSNHHGKSQMTNIMDKSQTVRDFCRTSPRLLVKSQRKLCFQNPEVTAVAIFGLKTALKECNRQFRYSRWDCSNLRTGEAAKTMQDSPTLRKGYKETSFAQALSAASVAHAVARACSLGQILSCGISCNSPLEDDFKDFNSDEGLNNRIRPEKRAGTVKRKRDGGSGSNQQRQASVQVPKTWSWGGCAQGALEYGLRFSRRFLGSDVTRSRDLHSVVKRHNYMVGRITLFESAKLKCKCHGVSGSCEMKTCWKSPTDFRHTGRKLRKRYYRARQVSLSNVAAAKGSRLNINLDLEPVGGGSNPRPIKDKELIYYESSPTFCDPYEEIGWKGTQGRVCNATHNPLHPETARRPNGCSSLCCGRGYDTIRRKRSRKCNCTFTWCCTVSCSTCNTVEWVTVCK